MNLEERQSLRSRHVQLSLSLPLTLVDVIDRYGDSIGSDTSATVADLVRAGLKLKAAQVEHQRQADEAMRRELDAMTSVR